MRSQDWIQDSMLERNRRIRHAKTTYASHRGPHGEITMEWLWSQFRKVVDDGQVWFVVGLVGTNLAISLILGDSVHARFQVYA